MRGRLRTTLDIFFGRTNSTNKNINSGTITPATLASRQNSVSRGISQDSDLISGKLLFLSTLFYFYLFINKLFLETASVTSERARENPSGYNLYFLIFFFKNSRLFILLMIIILLLVGEEVYFQEDLQQDNLVLILVIMRYKLSK